MSGRRKGEPRRLNHDLFVGIRKWNQLDQARVRELYENVKLRQAALEMVKQIKLLAADMEQSAIEALAHSLVRDALKAENKS